MKKPILYFDMDGTITDLYSFNNWLDYLQKELVKPYRNAAPLVDTKRANSLMRYLRMRGYQFSIITWCSMNSSAEYERRTKRAKADWLHAWFPGIFFENKMVPYGVPKHSLVDAKGNYLFDDNAEVGKAWEAAGGIWVNAKEKNIVDVLEELAAA